MDRGMRGATIVFILAMLSAPLARADEGSDDPAARQQRAKAMWDEGTRRYDLGKFDESIGLFLRAYETWPYPAILFNLCQAYRQKSDYKKATFCCKAFLRNEPNAKNRDVVEDLIIDMEETLARQEATNERPPDGVERPGGPIGGGPPREGGTRFGALKWTALGVGAAALAVGVTLIAIHEEDSSGGLRMAEATDTRLAGIILAVAGGALVGTGVVLWVMDRPSGGGGRVVGVAWSRSW